MINDDKNGEDSIFKDFEYVPDNVETDNDISEFNEDTIEKALKNIAFQMTDAPDDLKEQTLLSQTDEETKKPDENIETEANEPQNAINDEKQEAHSDINENADLEVSDKTQNVEKDDEKNNQDISCWEEFSDSDNVVKKYIVYISKDFVPYIDSMSSDERSAYINDAIQYKLDLQDEKKQKYIKRSILIHTLIAVFTIILLTPVCLWIAQKAILATFDNYKYSQENFEKLYKHRFEKDRAYIRSLEYNQELKKKIKESSH